MSDEERDYLFEFTREFMAGQLSHSDADVLSSALDAAALQWLKQNGVCPTGEVEAP